MRHMIKTLSLSLAAVFVFGAMAAASASASQPKAELESGAFPVSFTGSGGAGKLETVAEGTKVRTVNCTGNNSSGKISGATTISAATVKFTGCTATGPFGIKLGCKTSGAATEEIVTNALKGTLFYIKSGSSEAGVDLEPESGTEFAKFVCGGIQEISVTGSVVGKLTPVNAAFGTAFTLEFVQKAGLQSPEGYLAASGCGFTKDVLMSKGTSLGFGGENFAAIQSGVEGKESITTGSKMKIVSNSCA